MNRKVKIKLLFVESLRVAFPAACGGVFYFFVKCAIFATYFIWNLRLSLSVFTQGLQFIISFFNY